MTEKPSNANLYPHLGLQRLRIQNYRSIAGLTLELAPLTAIVGRNAVGKSNIADAIQFLGDVAREGITAAISKPHRLNFESVVRRGASTIEYRIEGVFTHLHENVGSYTVTLGPAENYRPGPVVLEERLEIDGLPILERQGPISPVYLSLGKFSGQTESTSKPKGDVESSRDVWLHVDVDQLAVVNLSANLWQSHEISLGRALLGLWVVRLESAVLRQEGNLANPQLGPRGENLAAVLDELPGDRLAALTSDLRVVVPNVQELVLVDTVPGRKVLALREVSSPELFFPHQISDGTLHFIALAAIAYGAIPGPIVVIEEPETGLHPGQFFHALELLRRGAEKHGQAIIVTTHAPYLVNRLDPRKDKLILLTRRDGTTEVVPLPEGDALLERLNEFEGPLGELWASGLLEAQGGA